jgi:hypothetical protein
LYKIKQSKWNDKTGSDVTLKGFPGCAHAQPEIGGEGMGVFPDLFRVFSDMLCSTPRPRSHRVE